MAEITFTIKCINGLVFKTGSNTLQLVGSGTHSIAVKLANGYTEKSTSNIYVVPEGSDTARGILSYNRSEKIWEGTATFYASGTYIIDGINVAQKETPKAKFTNNLQNCVLLTDVSNIDVGASVTLKIDANAGYHFDRNKMPYVTKGDEYIHPFDYKTKSVTYIAGENNTLEGSAYRDKTPVTVNTSLSLCSLNTDVSSLNVGDIVLFTINANENCYFKTVPTLNDGGTSHNFSLNEALNVATLTHTIVNESININANAVERVEPTKGDSKYFRVFNPSDETLDKLQSLVFKASNLVQAQEIDVSKYIFNMYRTFVPLNDFNKSSRIFLGSYDTGLTANYTEKEIEKIESSEIEAGLIDIFDSAKYCDAKIYIPFIGLVDVDNNVIRSGKLKIVFTCSFMDMKVVADVCINNIPVYTYSGNFGMLMPYHTGNNKFSFLYSINTFYKKDCYLLFIHHGHVESYQEHVGNSTKKWFDSLGVLDGYAEVENVKLSNNTQMLNSEKDRIISILNNGVYF